MAHPNSSVSTNESTNAPSTDPRFLSKRNQERYIIDISRRRILGCQFIEYPPLKDIRCYDWCASGLAHFICTCNEDYYEGTIRQFFTNLSIDLHGNTPTRLTSKVDDIPISFSSREFRELLHTQIQGVKFVDDDWAPLHVSKESVINSIFRPKTNPNANGDWLSKNLNFQEFLLHRILCRVIFPQHAPFKIVTDTHMFYIYGLKNKIPLDFGSAIMIHMQNTLQNPSLGLPYGSIITYLLKTLGWNPNGLSYESNVILNVDNLALSHIVWDPEEDGWRWRGVVQKAKKETSSTSSTNKRLKKMHNQITNNTKILCERQSIMYQQMCELGGIPPSYAFTSNIPLEDSLSESSDNE